MFTKNDDSAGTVVCSQSALAASTPESFVLSVNTPFSTPEQHELSSLTFDSLRPRQHGADLPAPAMRLTERDREIVVLVYSCRALRGDQIQAALFTEGGSSRCQRRLTLLVRHHYLDTLARKAVNEPAVYILSRRSVAGNRLLRERFSDDEFRRRMIRLGSLEHLLAVNDVRVRVERACSDLGWTLSLWRTPEELSPLLASTHLLPDAYFKIGRMAEGQERTAAFFLEFERVAKSSRVVYSKLKRYAEFYYGGRYQQLFGTRALRILVVFAEDGKTRSQRIQKAVSDAEKLGITIARFTSLQYLKAQKPEAGFVEPIWYEPGGTKAAPLFTR